MRISEAAAISGLGIDTIRYYEKSGIVPCIDRGSDGQRRFTPENIDWLTLLYWLRQTGMPLKTMRRFATLYAQGGQTVPARKAVLMAHAEQLAKRREELDRCEVVLAHKLAIYEEFEKGTP
ncbi:MerR family transcriptional regulator [Roseobacter sp. YSTF-M11]|uniref:MerR family transcriptional regulator n=1 Tax=Roseobacter insulae TaxID=2859783 RepID=A0A9X1K1G9_9RHOB|nr:MerR family transcriptional regulator [Roseobacter insulae]MBW4709199.1 MerR family transcriptional regulator [Roseobacter insulae]